MIIICRQLQDLNMHQHQHHKEQFQLLRDIQQLEGGISFFLELPTTLMYRIIARYPKISGKLVDYAKLHGVQIHFIEADSNIKATCNVVTCITHHIIYVCTHYVIKYRAHAGS